jgi:hypothetical protein
MTPLHDAASPPGNLPVADDAKVDLAYTARPGCEALDPEAIVGLAVGDGFGVIGITDLARVDRIPALTARALARGIWAVPGIRLRTDEGMVWAWGFDYQDPRLLALLAGASAGASLRHGDVVPLLRRLGGEVERGDPPQLEVETGAALRRWLAQVDPGSLLRRWFERLEWRGRYLDSAELQASLWLPEIVLLPSTHGALLDLADREPAPAAHPQPFAVVSPCGMSALPSIRERVAVAAGIVKEAPVGDYPQLAWRLYGICPAPLPVRQKSLLRFDLDRALFGRNDGWLFVTAPGSLAALAALKVQLRHELGVRVYRVRSGDTVDTCVSGHLHVPDPDRLALEYAWLGEFRLV